MLYFITAERAGSPEVKFERAQREEFLNIITPTVECLVEKVISEREKLEILNTAGVVKKQVVTKVMISFLEALQTQMLEKKANLFPLGFFSERPYYFLLCSPEEDTIFTSIFPLWDTSCNKNFVLFRYTLVSSKKDAYIEYAAIGMKTEGPSGCAQPKKTLCYWCYRLPLMTPECIKTISPEQVLLEESTKSNQANEEKDNKESEEKDEAKTKKSFEPEDKNLQKITVQVTENNYMTTPVSLRASNNFTKPFPAKSSNLATKSQKARTPLRSGVSDKVTQILDKKTSSIFSNTKLQSSKKKAVVDYGSTIVIGGGILSIIGFIYCFFLNKSY